MTNEQMKNCLAVLKEVQREFRVNTNLDTAIRTYESRIRELEKISG